MDKYLIDNTLYTSKFTIMYVNNQINWLEIQIKKYTDELSFYELKQKNYDENSDAFKSFQFGINNTMARINTATQIKNFFNDEVNQLNIIHTKFIYQENIMKENYIDKINKIHSLMLNDLQLTTKELYCLQSK